MDFLLCRGDIKNALLMEKAGQPSKALTAFAIYDTGASSQMVGASTMASGTASSRKGRNAV